MIPVKVTRLKTNNSLPASNKFLLLPPCSVLDENQTLYSCHLKLPSQKLNTERVNIDTIRIISNNLSNTNRSNGF